MFLTGHMQNAYVTHDLDKAMEIVGNRYGIEKFDRFDPDMTILTPHGVKPMANRVASYWAGGLNIEIIQPVSGYVDDYVAMLPADKTDAVPRFHHISLRRDDEAEGEQGGGDQGELANEHGEISVRTAAWIAACVGCCASRDCAMLASE